MRAIIVLFTIFSFGIQAGSSLSQPKRACDLNFKSISDFYKSLIHYVYPLENPAPEIEIFQKNIEGYGLGFFFKIYRRVEAIHLTQALAYQFKFIHPFFKKNKQTQELFQLLFEQRSSREDIQDWLTRSGSQFKLLWHDEVINIAQTKDHKLKKIYKLAKKEWIATKLHPKDAPLVRENGVIEEVLYFKLIENNYMPLMNDHDLSTHLPQIIDKKVIEITKEVFKRMNSPKYDVSWLSKDGDYKRSTLQAIWEMNQELDWNIFKHKGKYEISIMGGYVTAFSKYFLYHGGQFTDGLLNPYRDFVLYNLLDKIHFKKDSQHLENIINAIEKRLGGDISVNLGDVLSGIKAANSYVDSLTGKLAFETYNKSTGKQIDKFKAAILDRYTIEATYENYIKQLSNLGTDMSSLSKESIESGSRAWRTERASFPILMTREYMHEFFLWVLESIE